MNLNKSLKRQFQKINSTDYLLVALGAVLIITLLLFLDQYKDFKESGGFSAPVMAHHHLHRVRDNISVNDIQGWMTFNYLNKIFHLPPQLLQEQLRVTNPKYLALSIRDYSLRTHQPQTEVIKRIQTIIQNNQTGK